MGDAATKSFSISIVNSVGSYEGNETVNLALSNATGASLGTQATAVLTITENDLVPVEGSVQFSAPTYSVAEDGVTALINVTRTGVTGDFGVASVDYVITDGRSEERRGGKECRSRGALAVGDAGHKGSGLICVHSQG